MMHVRSLGKMIYQNGMCMPVLICKYGATMEQFTAICLDNIIRMIEKENIYIYFLVMEKSKLDD